jgi:oxygen-dependent protoporphyrinogen oxidase
MNKHVVVIGGGMAGASAARVLKNYGYKVTIVEKNDYIGGRVHTRFIENTAIEMGAGFMTRLYTNVYGLLKDSRLDTQLHKQHRANGMLRDGQVRMATLKTLAGNSALSASAKLQLIPLLLKTLAHWRHLDHHAFWKGAIHDNRSIGDAFANSNQELLEYLLQPIVNGYFYWAPEHVSEEMVLALCKAALVQRGAHVLTGGLQQIPEKAAEGNAVLLNSEVLEVKQTTQGSFDVMIKRNGSQELLRADGIICATTATAVPQIFTNLIDAQKTFFTAVHYSSTAVVSQTFKRSQTLGDKGIAFPRKEDIALSAITLASDPNKNDLATLKMYASGTIGARLCEQSDTTIAHTLVQGMEPVRSTVLIGNPSPIATHIQRWPEALPFFDVGHLKRLEAFEEGRIENQDQAVAFAGDYLDGPFIEGAFTSGIKAAERLHARLTA